MGTISLGVNRASSQRILAAALLGLVGAGLLIAFAPRVSEDTAELGAGLLDDVAGERWADFSRHFGSDDLLLLGIETREGALRLPALLWADALVESIVRNQDVQTVVSLNTLQDFAVRRIAGALVPTPPRDVLPADRTALPADLLSKLRSDPFLSRGLLSADGRTAVIWVILKPRFADAEDAAMRLDRLLQSLPEPPDRDHRLRASGIPLLRRALRVRLTEDGFLLATLAICGIGLFVGWFFSSGRALVAWYLGWVLGAGLLVTLACALGRPVHAFTHALLPILVVVSGGTFVHLQGSSRPRREVFLACALASLTTMVGFAGLMTSPLLSLARLGEDCVLGVPIVFLSTALLQRLLIVGDPPRHGNVTPPRLSPWGKMAALMLAMPWFLIPGNRIEAEVDALGFLPGDQPEVVDAKALEQAVGAAASFELVLRLPAATPPLLEDPNFLLRLADFQDRVVALSDGNIDFILGPVTLMAYLNTRMVLDREPTVADFRTTPAAARFASAWLIRPFLGMKSKRPTEGSLMAALYGRVRNLVSPDGARVRFNCRVHDASPGAILEFERRLESEGPSMARALGLSQPPFVTGRVLLDARTGRAIQQTQVRALGLSAALLALLVLLILRDVRLFAVTLATNALTLCGVLSLMGLAGIEPDYYTTILIASVLSVLVDDSFHFLVAWQDARGTAGDRAALALAQVRSAVVGSTLALAVGFATFAVSSLPPFRRVALLAVWALGLALFWDLVVLPWLVARVGRATRD